MKIKRQDTSIPVFSYVMDIFLFSFIFSIIVQCMDRLLWIYIIIY